MYLRCKLVQWSTSLKLCEEHHLVNVEWLKGQTDHMWRSPGGCGKVSVPWGLGHHSHPNPHHNSQSQQVSVLPSRVQWVVECLKDCLESYQRWTSLMGSGYSDLWSPFCVHSMPLPISGHPHWHTEGRDDGVAKYVENEKGPVRGEPQNCGKFLFTYVYSHW